MRGARWRLLGIRRDYEESSNESRVGWDAEGWDEDCDDECSDRMDAKQCAAAHVWLADRASSLPSVRGRVSLLSVAVLLSKTLES